MTKKERLTGLLSFASLSFLIAGSVLAADSSKSLSVTSTAITEGAAFAKKYTADGEDLSPPLSWSSGPAGTKSYALSCEDPDAPVGTWWHWILFNIPADTHQLGENVPKLATMAKGVLQGSNDFQKTGYNGPAPPPGKVHHYQFKVLALDCILNLKANCSKESYKAAVKGHALAEGQLTGTYKR